MKSNVRDDLMSFLRDELSVSEAAIALALKKGEQELNFLPMVLWQYGFITLPQLNRVFDWLEMV
ncbi:MULTISPECIES: DUF2949 domain-containing protein [Chroococcidiopsis]|jgi:hypothetical protein|uniref:DUF2949 domain-containing protein n=2 Tax=Chroococcidiopsis TaxID=54298 RepID=K9U8S5_CHRTP|nr:MULTISPECIES: DUF2949 domain-containing protein [Chroococcidiopsis]MBE9018403.1 DUF2949 domain-containing protein [Chroococcidiopsidales cyanobacterium LEGE 13417]OWY65306.1 hypothetical protein B7486_42600 [cyanobacterium TDX16]PSB47264.1 DUF2949 domain-containing protein [Cyanosarcina cf. burmensis CCALA 770]AFY90821.1 hypothetical protein Chro_5459 [Chroococcidiopsis thermalis PCC 7203]MDZ4876526.1 hypothetical protein [Chroococcidiopsis cubana SAG 39.79]